MPMQPKGRSLRVIANEIEKEWTKVDPFARPHLDAMKMIDKVTDEYGTETGRDMIYGFLVNSTHFVGERARALKAELRALLNEGK